MRGTAGRARPDGAPAGVTPLVRLFAVAVIVVTVGVGAVLSRSGFEHWAFEDARQADMLYARTLLDHSTFSGEAFSSAPQPGRARPPGYPAVLAVIAALDARVAAGLTCYGRAGRNCTAANPFGTVTLLLVLAGAAVLYLVHLLALEITGTRWVSYPAVVLFVILARLGEYARQIRPDNLQNLALFAGLLLVAVAARRKSATLSLAAGASFGVAGLFHPPFLYFLPLAALTVLLLPSTGWVEPVSRPSLRLGGGALLAGAALVAAPWALRNAALFGDLMLTDAYEASLLAERLAYDDMTALEWWAAPVRWMPSYGDIWSRALFGAATIARLEGAEPGAFATEGEAIFASVQAALAAGASPVEALLAETTGLSPTWHAATTVPLFTRGLWGSHGFLAILGIACLPIALSRIARAARAGAALAVTGTCLLLLLGQAIATPNYYWNNLPMAFLGSLAIAFLLRRPLEYLSEKAQALRKSWRSAGR